MCMRVSPTDSGNSGILFVGFNQDYGCFAVGMQNGFRIFNCDPLKQLERYEIILVNAVKVYTFSPSPQLIFESNTCSNPSGLCYVCQSVDNPLVVFPGRRPGVVSLVHIGNTGSNVNLNNNANNNNSGNITNNNSNTTTNNNIGSTNTISINTICPSSTNATNMPPRQIIAHENPLASITLNRDGYLLATASQKGTLIRIFSTKDCTLLHELRRGTSQATITSLSFNKDSDLLCVTSERGTAHIFCLTKDSLTNPLLSADGSYYKYTFTANGTVTRVTFVNFLDFYDDETDF
ncbi:LOW QUALITY PROTEIN: putative wd-repeat protein [Schistosoma mansoni]|uniref:putative wd-repeat protein n=1 Tax=Schistosoma mansoni TaxID=6183 RepID=UPI00022DBFC2|nr:LOW QUALITY PROTEIN: putative wd-repeat protein [Schistosoma mansoni]|eukprot:XP_018653187.1 LOW QUALITY PROTEIN: putative wd-repeat protein [Schistosoma mansoni]